MMKPIINTEYQ